VIRKLLVANRGEIAVRILRTAREMDIATVAVHSDPDAGAPFVAAADEAVRLPGAAPADTYLRGDLVIAAARATGADAIHPGYGFLSENAQFARDVVDAGLTWIGPDPSTIEAMGSKIRAKELMAAAGVPVLEVDPATATAADFPLLVKASAGGGGRGMRVVDDPRDLEAELARAGAEAASAFGDATVFVEPYLATARHVEVQVMADAHGTCWVVGDRDCSIQRRHQKVVEEAPAPALSDAARATLHDAARKAAGATGYVGAGTVEFLVDGDRVFFLEMNTRLQVEHPVTEAVTGLDLVALQLAVAEGRALEGEPPAPSGHAVEVRLYAEDPADDWRPQTGTLRAFDVEGVAFANPAGHGLRVDSGVEAGSEVGVHYDAMLAKVIAHGPDRASALRMLDGALRRARVHGVATNTALLRAILGDEDVVAARVHTSLLDQRLEAWTKPAGDPVLPALAAAVAQAETARTSARVLGRVPAAYRNVPSQPRTRTFTVPGREEPLEVAYSSVGGRLVSDLATVVAATPTRVVLERDGVRTSYDVSVGETSVDVAGPEGALSLGVVPRFVDPSEVVAAGSLLAPMPAAVVSVAVQAGQRVERGQTVLVLEAMKMQHTVAAPADGVVTEVHVAAGSQVESGAVLAVVEEEQG
jgi:propionyl-CoA carboxylase alpha chain